MEIFHSYNVWGKKFTKASMQAMQEKLIFAEFSLVSLAKMVKASNLHKYVGE